MIVLKEEKMKKNGDTAETLDSIITLLANSGLMFCYPTMDGICNLNPDKLFKFLQCENDLEREALVLDVTVQKLQAYKRYQSHQCAGITKSGKRCKNLVFPKIYRIEDYNGEPGEYCWAHGG